MPTKKSVKARFEPASDQSLLIYFGEQITLEANECVRRLLRLLEQEPVPGVRNLHPAYCSLQRAIRGMQVAHTWNRFLLQKTQKPSHALVCFERDLFAEINEQRLVACWFESRFDALLRGHVRESIPVTPTRRGR